MRLTRLGSDGDILAAALRAGGEGCTGLDAESDTLSVAASLSAMVTQQ